MTDPEITPDELDVLAGEAVCGVLDPAEHALATTRRLNDPAFAAAVGRWERRLAPLFEEVSPVEPPRSVWNAIAVRLQAAGAGAARPGASRVVPLRRVRFWQAAAASMGALAAVLGTLLLVRPAPVPPVVATRPAPPVVLHLAVAQLLDKNGAPLLVAGFDRGSGRLRLRVVDLDGGDKVPELWVIPAGGTPRSLGLIANNGRSEEWIAPATRGYLSEGATLAVTLEPRNGAPHASPSGGIVTSGPLSVL